MEMKKMMDNIVTSHAITEALAAEARDYDLIFAEGTMDETERSEWEKKWRDEFEHHVSCLDEVTHLLGEFLKGEDCTGGVAENIVIPSENVMPELSKQNRDYAIKIAEEVLLGMEGSCLSSGGDEFLIDIATKVSNILSLLKGEDVSGNI